MDEVWINYVITKIVMKYFNILSFFLHVISIFNYLSQISTHLAILPVDKYLYSNNFKNYI